MKRRTMRRTALAALGSAALVVSLALVVSAAVGAGGGPVRSRESLTSVQVSLPSATTTIASASPVAATASAPAYCAVKLVVKKPPSSDQVRISVWTPIDNWNGRFQGTGGGGFSGGSPDAVPVTVLQAGYAAAGTDTGPSDALANIFGTFAVSPDGTPNSQLINDFGYLGIHEMTVAGKTLVREFYGRTSFYSYWNGCSTGGRQGIMEAQRYPDDYDGIAAASPAINWTKLHPAQLWVPW
jgi:feruloyl esterase